LKKTQIRNSVLHVFFQSLIGLQAAIIASKQHSLLLGCGIAAMQNYWKEWGFMSNPA